jgi:hypothetical protein
MDGASSLPLDVPAPSGVPPGCRALRMAHLARSRGPFSGAVTVRMLVSMMAHFVLVACAITLNRIAAT